MYCCVFCFPLFRKREQTEGGRNWPTYPKSFDKSSSTLIPFLVFCCFISHARALSLRALAVAICERDAGGVGSSLRRRERGCVQCLCGVCEGAAFLCSLTVPSLTKPRFADDDSLDASALSFLLRWSLEEKRRKKQKEKEAEDKAAKKGRDKEHEELYSQRSAMFGVSDGASTGNAK